MKRHARLQQLPEPKAAKKRRNRPEQQLHKAIADHLKIRGTSGSFWFHPPNGLASRSKIEAKIFKSLGMKAGVPDLMLVRAGALCAMEVKAPGRKPSKAQRETIDELTAAGCMVRVIDNIDDAVAWLEKLGFLRGRAQ